jgi:hypothetical protein
MDMRAPSDAVLPPLMRDGAELSTAAVAALCEHPQFPAAMRAMMTDNVRLFRGNRILNYVGYDRGRLVIGILALYLHTTRRADDPGSGLTAQRLKSLCVEQELCSTGRARAMLSLLRLFGYVAPAEGSDGRYKFLAPTELLITFLRDRWNAMFDAVALIAPEGAAARAALAHDDFLAAISQRRSGAGPRPRARAVRGAQCRADDPVEPRHRRRGRRHHAAVAADQALDLGARATLLGLARARAAAPARRRSGRPDQAHHRRPGDGDAHPAAGAGAAGIGRHAVPVLRALRPHRAGGCRLIGPVKRRFCTL